MATRTVKNQEDLSAFPEKSVYKLREIVKKDKKKYAELREAFAGAKSDEQRIGLIQGAVLTDKKLRAINPAGLGGEAAATWTVVVVTVTITWPSTAERPVNPGELVMLRKKVIEAKTLAATKVVRKRLK